MKNSEKNKLLKWNTILWLAAMALPAFFSIAFASTKFPWPMILPLLLIGPMMASNKMLTQAIKKTPDDQESNVRPLVTTGMNVSPRILSRVSWGLVPMSLLHLASTVVTLLESHKAELRVVSIFWWLIFYVGGIVLMFVVGTMVVIRRGGHAPYRLVDRIALEVAILAIIAFLVFCRD